MGNESLYIICKKCGQHLGITRKATWEYLPAIKDEKTGEIIHPPEVLINCRICGTIHFLSNHIKTREEYLK